MELTTAPSNGGLAASNYPNTYVNSEANGGGLRTWEEHNNPKDPEEVTGYGGRNAMPKGDGWFGVMKNTGSPDSVSTELSTGDDIGDFPTMSKSQSPEQLKRILALKPNERIPDDIYETARRDANVRRGLGLSPFKDYN